MYSLAWNFRPLRSTRRVNEYGSTQVKIRKEEESAWHDLAAMNDLSLARGLSGARINYILLETECVYGGGGGNAKHSNGIAGNRGANRSRPHEGSPGTHNTDTYTHTCTMHARHFAAHLLLVSRLLAWLLLPNCPHRPKFQTDKHPPLQPSECRRQLVQMRFQHWMFSQRTISLCSSTVV